MNTEKTPLNRIEEINKAFCGSHFVKQYEVLDNIGLPNQQVRLIELVLSFQFDQKKPFRMSYQEIANRIGSMEETVKVYVFKLKKLGLIKTDPKSNWNPATGLGGRRTTILVNIDALVGLIREKVQLSPTIIQQPSKASGRHSNHAVEPLQETPKTPIDKEIPTKKENITKPVEVIQNDSTEVNYGCEYEFKLSDFNASKMLLRYTDNDETFSKLMNDFDWYWMENNTGILELSHVVDWLMKRIDEDNDPQTSNMIHTILTGITNDYQKVAQLT